MSTRSMVLIAAIGVLSLTGCSNSCERIQNKIEKIGQEIAKKPETAMDRADELEELREELEKKGCLG